MLNKKEMATCYGKRFFYNNKKGFLQISFAWLFAIIVGAIILFFAIYASVRLIGTEESTSTAQAGKEIAVLLNPLETGFGEETTTPLSTGVGSRINNNCAEFGDFGSQEISVSQMSRGEWTDAGLSQSFHNKYIFSGGVSEGKNFYLFSKPLEFPFKVADLIILTSAEDRYCLSDAPDDIKEELAQLGQGNLFTENCPDNSVKICFASGSGCDVVVNENQKAVTYEDNNEKVYYEKDALMYAAIFSNSDSELYECQVKRLMQRLSSLALIYNDKESLLSSVGCTAEVGLLGLAEAANALGESSDLITVRAFATRAENENKRAYCKLW